MKTVAAALKFLCLIFGAFGIMAFFCAGLNGQSSAGDYAGEWHGMYELNGRTFRGLSFTLAVEGEAVTGTYQIENGNAGTIVGTISDDDSLSLGFVHSGSDCEGELAYVGRMVADSLISFEVSGWDCSGAGGGGGYATRNLVDATTWMTFGIVKTSGGEEFGDFYARVDLENVSAARVITPDGFHNELALDEEDMRWKESFFGSVDYMEERYPDGIYAYEIDLEDGSVVYDIQALAGEMPEVYPEVLSPVNYEYIPLGEDLTVSWEEAPAGLSSVFLSTYFNRGAVVILPGQTSYTYDGSEVVADESGDVYLTFNVGRDGVRSNKFRGTRVDLNATGSRTPAVEAYVLQGEYGDSGDKLIFTCQFRGGDDVSSAEMETPGGEVLAFEHLEHPEDLALGDGQSDWAITVMDDLTSGMARFSAGDYELRIQYADTTTDTVSLNNTGVFPSGRATIDFPSGGMELVDEGAETIDLQWSNSPGDAEARVVLVHSLRASTIPDVPVIDEVERGIVSDFVSLSEPDSGSFLMDTELLNWDKVYQMQVIHLSAAGDFYGCTGAKPVFFTTPKSGFQAWQVDHFSESELLDAAISGLDGDPDRDGLSNFEEFVYGCNPEQSDSAGPLNLVFEAFEDARKLMVEIRMNPDVAEDAVVLEMSFDCVNWFPVLNVPGLYESPESGVRRMETGDVDSAFYRLSVDGDSI